MPDTIQTPTDRQAAAQPRDAGDVRVYPGPTHQWIVLARIDLTQQEAERLVQTPGGTPPLDSISGYSDITCWRCELTIGEALATCLLG